MSEELKVELLNYKKERNKKILIIGLIALFLSLFFVVTYAIYYQKDQVYYVEYKAEIEQKSRFIKSSDLYYFSRNSTSISEKQKKFKKYALSLCSTRDPRFSYCDRPRKSKAKYRKSFKKIY